jgi:hypothetical protein
MIAMGPLIALGTLAVPSPPYILLAKALGFIQRLWWPARAFAYVDVLMFLMAAVLLERAVRWGPWRHRTLLAGATAVTAGCLLRAGLLPFPSWDASVPAGYRCLAGEPEGSLIELPYGWTQAHLYYQSAHGRPILGGMLERNPVFIPEQARDFMEDNPFVSTLIDAARSGAMEAPAGFESGREEAQDLSYRWVLLQRDAYFTVNDHQGDDEIRRLMRAQQTRLRKVERNLERLLGPPLYSDGRTLIFPVDPDHAVAPPCAALERAGRWDPDPEHQAPRPVSATSSVRQLPIVYLR